MVSIDIFDYSNTLVCPLYSSDNELSGGATDVVITFQRNGAKTLSFTLPDKMIDDSGQSVENFRCEYLKADYLIRVYDSDCRLDGDDTDFFIISEPKIIHQNMSAIRNVTCDHVSALLKTKNLGLVFSETEGNNVGKAEDILAAILDGSGWTIRKVNGVLDVDIFFEKHRQIDYNDPQSIDENTKRRTLVASERTGAFNLISKLCDLFEARAIYHGKDNTVSMHVMNPFSKEDDLDKINDKADSIYELHYGKNVKTITKTLNTENLTTRLYAYGSYGDHVNGYCNIDKVTHNEWIFHTDATIPQNTECMFTVDDNIHIQRTRYFTTPFIIPSGSDIIWSELDPASMSYVYIDQNKKAIKVYEKMKTSSATVLEVTARNEEQNLFPCLMDFSYYDEIGLFKEEQLQRLAEYQREAPSALRQVHDESTEMSADMEILNEAIGSNEFVKLENPTFSLVQRDYFDSGTKNYLKISYTGLEYTSQYLLKERDWFTWRHVENGFKQDGQTLMNESAIVYIIRDMQHPEKLMTSECFYLMEGERTSGEIIVNCTNRLPDYFDNARVYLFSSSSINRDLGSTEIALRNIPMTIKTMSTYVNNQHPLYILNETNPEPSKATGENGYAWSWRYRDENGNEMRSFKFSYATMNNGDWLEVLWGRTMPACKQNTWFYNWVTKVLYFNYPGQDYWTQVNNIDTVSVTEKMVETFPIIITNCLQYNKYIFGVYDQYQYTTPNLVKGNYAWHMPDDSFYTFGTTEYTAAGTLLTLDTIHHRTTHANLTDPYSTTSCSFDAVTYMPENSAAGKVPTEDVWLNRGIEEANQSYNTSGFIKVYNDAVYITNVGVGYVTLYDVNNNYLETHIFSSGVFDTQCVNKTDKTGYVRLSIAKDVMPDLRNLLVTMDGYISYKDDAAPMPGQPEWAVSYAVVSQHINLALNREVKTVNNHKCTIGIPLSYGKMYAVNLGSFSISYFDKPNVERDNPIQSYNVNNGNSLYSFISVPYGATQCDICQTADTTLDVHESGCDRIFVLADEMFEILPEPYTPVGNNKGLIALLNRFANTADRVYGIDYAAVKQAQSDADAILKRFINSAGYMYREGWLQKNDYVSGKEQELYDDALETLREISRPEEKYDISFLNTSEVANWNDVINPVITAASAIHIIDDDIGISKWAFVDKLSWCIDQPWKTQLQVNTNLSTITSHSFADVMQHIAEVSNTMSGKDALYKRAAYLSNYGEFLANNLEGQILLDKVKIIGASSSLIQTDDGNFILEAVDGSSAVMISAGGIALASSKNEDGDWNWRTLTTGEGLTADLITSGTLRSSLIQAGMITTEMLAAPVGSELNVYSNKSVRLVADEQIYEKGFSNGVNLMRAASSSRYTTNDTIDLNYVEIPENRSTNKIVYRVYLKPFYCSARADLVIISSDGTMQEEQTLHGDVIGNDASGWSTVTAEIGDDTTLVLARITKIEGFGYIEYNSPKVELGKMPTDFTVCPDDIETDTVNLSRAVLEVNPRFISQSVSSDTVYSNHDNLYSETFDKIETGNKNRYHGFTFNRNTHVRLNNMKQVGDYTISFLAISDVNCAVTLRAGSESHDEPGLETVVQLIAGHLHRVVYRVPLTEYTIDVIFSVQSSVSNTMTISNFMVERGNIASAWCANADSNIKNSENLIINGGFSYYIDGKTPSYDTDEFVVNEDGTGVIDKTAAWEKQSSAGDSDKLFSFVVGKDINEDVKWHDGTSSFAIFPDYVDSDVNTLVVGYTGTIPEDADNPFRIGISHSPINVEEDTYHSLRMYVSGLGLSRILVVINDADRNGNIIKENTRKNYSTIGTGNSLDKYTVVDIPFQTASSMVDIEIHGYASGSMQPLLFVANCKLEQGLYPTPYSDSQADLNNANEKIAGLARRVSKAEIQIDPDKIVQTVTTHDTYINGIKKIATSTTQQEATRIINEFGIDGEALTWFQKDAGGLRIGKSNENTTMLLTNNRLSFQSNDIESAYIGAEGLMVSKASFINSFNLGNPAISTPLTVFLCADGSINFGWSE